jgi:hypothetical protein
LKAPQERDDHEDRPTIYPWSEIDARLIAFPVFGTKRGINGMA